MAQITSTGRWHGIMILRHDKMAVLGFPGSVAWEFSPPIWHGALEMTTFDK
jgi:hypothetical protein